MGWAECGLQSCDTHRTSTFDTDQRLHAIVAAQPYPLLFVTVSGAHLYGFPSPDLVYHLHGLHMLPWVGPFSWTICGTSVVGIAHRTGPLAPRPKSDARGPAAEWAGWA